MSKRPGEPSPVLSPLYLVEAGFPVGEHPDPVPAPFTGAVGAPTSFRACHHSIPLGDGPHDLRERKVAERKLLRQSCPDRCVTFPGEVRICATRPRRGRDHDWLGGCGRRRGGERPLGGSRLCPAFAGFPWSQMCFCFTKTSGRGYPPDPRNDVPRATKGRPPGHGSSPETRGRAQDPHDRRARGACLHALETLTSDRPAGGVPRVHIDIGVHVHGITESMCAGKDSVCGCPRCGCTTAARTAVPFQSVRPWRE